jgi:anti-sigma regulatory factor (Ser/Thr protein kinase)
MEQRLLQVRLPIQPGWDAIEPLRVSVQACVKAVFPDAALAARIALTAAELMENAVKYGAWGAAGDGRFELVVAGQNGHVTIEVSNPVDPADPHFNRLREELDRIATAPSPQEAFLRGVRSVALKRRTSLGLARIVHEGGCDLTTEVVGNVLTVRAVTRRGAVEEPTPASAT